MDFGDVKVKHAKNILEFTKTLIEIIKVKKKKVEDKYKRKKMQEQRIIISIHCPIV